MARDRNQRPSVSSYYIIHSLGLTKTIEVGMDKINLRILRALSKNARISFSELAKQVHLSAPAVAERVKRLEETGVIKGYKPLINLERIGIPISALVECQVYRTKEKEFLGILMNLDEVIKIYNITGVTTFIVELGVTKLSELDEILELMVKFCDTNTKLIMQIPYDDALPQRVEKILQNHADTYDL